MARPLTRRRIESQLTEGRISASIWKLAFPMMISGALQDLFSMVDLYFVGQLGHIEVAALSMAGTVVSILVMIVQGIAIGTTALVAHSIGEKNYDRADAILGQSFLLSTVGSVVMIALAGGALPFILRLFGASGEVLFYAQAYLEITFFGSSTIFFFVVINQALRGTGDAKTPLYALVIANLINIFLDPLLIMGYGPFPRLGVSGSAAATIFSRGVGLIFLLIHLFFGHSTIRLELKHLKPSPVLMRRILSIGSFASLQVFIREISFVFLMRLVSSFGAVTLAAYGIGSRLRMAIMVPGFGFSNAASVLVGQNLGAEQPERAHRSAWQTLLYYEMIAIPLAVVFIAFAPSLVGFFNDQPEVVAVGASFLRFLGVTFPFLAISLIFGQAMNGAGDTRTPTVINGIGQLAFRIPVAYFLSLVAGLGPIGIWLGINSSDIIQGIGMAWAFQRGGWKKTYARHRDTLRRQTAAASE